MLAWRRSSLSFVVAGLLIGRVAMLESSPVLVVLCAVATGGALWLGTASLPRGRWWAPSEAEPQFVVLRDGVLPALLVLILAVLCVTVLALSLG